MKKMLYVLLFQIISINLNAQWTKTNGPGGAIVYSLSANSRNIFAGLSDGIYFSTNNGSSWISEMSGLPQKTSFISIAAKNNLIFAGTYNKGIFRSTNDGSSWDSVNHGLPVRYVWINGLAFSGDTIYAGIYTGNYGLVYFSADSGKSWNNASTGLPEFASVNGLTVSRNRIFAATTGGVYRTTDRGQNWIAVNNGIDYTSIVSIASEGDTLYAGTNYGGKGIFRSFDGGENWTLLNTGLNVTYVKAIAVKGSRVFAATYERKLIVSADNGETWNTVSIGLSDPDVYAFLIKEGNVFAGTYGGIFISTDNGSSWKTVNIGLNNSTAVSMLLKGDTLFAGTNTAVFYTSDNGSTWTMSNSGLDNTSVNSFVLSGNNIFTLTDKGIFRSENNGSDWQAANKGIHASRYNAIAAAGGHIITGTDSGVFVSADEGITWKASNSGMKTFIDSILYVSCLAVYKDIIFAGGSGPTGEGGIYLSSDFGSTWIPANNGIVTGTKIHINSIAAVNNRIFAAYNYGGLHHPDVVWSKDSGKSWSNITNGIPPYTETFRFHIIADSIYAITENGTFRFSFDSSSWVNAGKDFPGEILSSAFNNKYIFIGTNGSGIWRRPMPGAVVGINEKQSGIPVCFALGQNYPNPFNSSTIITYSLPGYSHVLLKIYDILGREILTLVNQEQNAGEYKISFNVSELPSGIYIYTIQTGQFIDSKKMLLLR